MTEVLLLIENRETRQFTFLSLHPDSVESLRRQLSKDWKVKVLTKHTQSVGDKGPHIEHG